MTISTRAVETMSPDERRAEIAELLARGVLRRREDDRRSGRPKFDTESVATCLEEGGKTRLSVPRG